MEVLVEQNVFGKADTSYVYGVDRLSADTYCGRNSYYLYDGRGSVTGLTNEKGWLYQSYKYSVTGEITFGAPQYDNEYTYNGESYNPNIESQYLRARYYNVVTATFLTEDSYLGEITNPLTLNRYNYTLSNYLNYQDPSGHDALGDAVNISVNVATQMINASKPKVTIRDILPRAGVAEALEPRFNIQDYIEIGISLGNVNYVNVQEIRNGWLNLYSSETVTSSNYIAREIELAESKHENKWCNHEYPYKDSTAYINPNAYYQMINNNDEVISKKVSRNFLVDAKGRYWVAVGPATLVENYPSDGKVQADDFAYGTMMDVMVSDSDSKEIFYIPVVVGDVKNHTYPNGMFHTGIPYPNSGDNTIADADYSYIEFIRTNKDENSPFAGLNLKIEGIIVYDKAK